MGSKKMEFKPRILKPVEFTFRAPTKEEMWMFQVDQTFCEHCDKLTPSNMYQGHYICGECGKVTSFILQPAGFPALRFPAKWNEDGTHIVEVQHTVKVEK